MTEEQRIQHENLNNWLENYSGILGFYLGWDIGYLG
jgi:hypothetical protein